MALLKKDVPEPMLPEPRAVPVPELGGEVIVRPLLLSQALGFRERFRNGSGRDYAQVPALLAQTVIDGAGEVLFSEQQWEVWGAVNPVAALKLFNEAWPLSGLATAEEDDEKKVSEQSSSSP